MFSFILLRNQHKICSCCCISISEFPETCDCSLDGSTLRTLLSAQGFLNHPPTNKFVVFPSRKKDRSVIPQRGKPRLCNSQKIHIKKSTEFKNYFQNLLQNLSFELKLLCHLISIFCLITINSPLTSSVQHINSLSDLYSL